MRSTLSALRHVGLFLTTLTLVSVVEAALRRDVTDWISYFFDSWISWLALIVKPLVIPASQLLGVEVGAPALRWLGAALPIVLTIIFWLIPSPISRQK